MGEVSWNFQTPTTRYEQKVTEGASRRIATFNVSPWWAEDSYLGSHIVEWVYSKYGYGRTMRRWRMELNIPFIYFSLNLGESLASSVGQYQVEYYQSKDAHYTEHQQHAVELYCKTKQSINQATRGIH